MKKIISLIPAFVFVLAITSYGQNNGRAFYKQSYKSRNSGSFDHNASILSLGYGFPNHSGAGYWRGGSRVGFGPAYLKYEHGIIDELGIGGYIAFAASRYKNNNDVEHTSAFGMGILAYYHFNKLIPVSQLDVYLGAGLGFRSWAHTDRDGIRDSNFDPLPIGKIGARWYFTPKFAVYAEGGYDDMSYVNIGITFRF
jgi:hypothetical protein